MTQGFAAVSHRAVARRAGLPLASTTYYFDSLEHLLAETVHRLATDWLEAARREAESHPGPFQDPGAAARMLVRIAVPAMTRPAGAARTAVLSFYERYVEAARLPELRSIVAGCDTQIEALLAQAVRPVMPHGTPDADREAAGRLLLAVIDGALLRALAEGEDPASVTDAVQSAVELLARPAPEP